MRLESAVAGAVATAQVSTPVRVTDVAALYGPSGKGAGRLATVLADAGVFKNRASALRNIERYIKAESGEPGQTRKPNAATQAALAEIARNKASIEAMRKDGVTVAFSGAVIVSPGGRRPDERDRDIDDVYLDSEHVGAFLDALEAHNTTGAADEFNAAFMDAYGIGDAVITDVYSLGFTIGGES